MLFKKKPKPEAGAGDSPETPAPEGGEGAEGDAPKKKKLPILIIAIAAGVLVLGGGGGAAFFMMQPKKAEAAEGGHKAEKPKKKKKEGGGHGGGEGKKDDKAAGVIAEGPDGVTYFTLPDLVVNIQAADGRPTYLKLKLTLETADEETAELIQEEQPRLKDMFTTFLRELRPEDLNGSQGSYQLRMEILRRVNLVVAPHKVNAVLIEEMLIQ